MFSREDLTADHTELAVSNVPRSSHAIGSFDIDETMITKASSQMKSSFNPGPDGFPSVLLKKHIDVLVTPLLFIFRASISSGVFPSCWKIAHMYPVYKKGDKRDVNNYRGITSLCAVSKLFELVIMEPLKAHCQQQLSEDQHGFMPGRSTASNLICLTSYIMDSMVRRNQTDVIYTDLTAAFDMVNHDIAIAKLDRFGINGRFLQWFRSYLTGRELKVVIGDCQTASFMSTSGIPQGSHLGPLIFLLFFNDVHRQIKVPRLSYADDLKIFLEIHSIEDCDLLQQQLSSFADWCTINRMIVNPTKCSVITFSRKRSPIHFSYQLMGAEIERVDHVKDLGVVLDTTLTFNQHVSYVVGKASRVLGCIFRIAKNFTDVYCLKSLYCSLSRSVLEYCSEVWSPNYSNGVERIESVQRRFLRFALRRLPWRDPFRLPSYENRCRLIDLEPLHVRRNTARALFIADSLQGRLDCPTILEQININVAPRTLRNNLMLRLPLRRTNYSMHGAINGLQRTFNRIASEFDFGTPRRTLRRRFSSFFANAAGDS